MATAQMSRTDAPSDISFAAWFTQAVAADNAARGIATATRSNIAERFHVSPATAGMWLDGTRKPQREQCVTIAKSLHPNLRITINMVLKAAGFSPVSDKTVATLPELIAYFEQSSPWDGPMTQKLLDRLRNAERETPQQWRDIVNLLLRQQWPLTTRATKIAQVVEAWQNQPMLQSA